MLLVEPLPPTLHALAEQPGTAALVTLLLLAAVCDARTYRIPNALTAGGMLLGLFIMTTTAPVPSTGFLRAAGGIAAMLLCLVPLHALRAMGGGDVKLMAMVGAFLGVPDVLPALLFVFVAGGVAALGAALFQGRALRLLHNVHSIVRSAAVAAVTGTAVTPQRVVSAGRLPFALPIAAGTIAFLVYRQVFFA